MSDRFDEEELVKGIQNTIITVRSGDSDSLEPQSDRLRSSTMRHPFSDEEGLTVQAYLKHAELEDSENEDIAEDLIGRRNVP